MMKTVLISDIPIQIHRKKIKNMHLYVKPPSGEVTVSAPLKMTDEAIERFVLSKLSWIEKQVNKFKNQPHQFEREYLSGETLYIWGKPHYIQTEYGLKNSLTLSGDKAILTVRKESTATQREKFVREWYRELLKTEVALLLPKWEKITGLKAATWQIKHMTTRWGTCNVKTGKIWLSLQLAKKPPECLEYVILHELTHFIEKKHNERFTSHMDKHMPMWKEVKAMLNGKAKTV